MPYKGLKESLTALEQLFPVTGHSLIVYGEKTALKYSQAQNSLIASSMTLSGQSLYFEEKCINSNFITPAFIAIDPAALAVR